jgi:hypothetical protein
MLNMWLSGNKKPGRTGFYYAAVGHCLLDLGFLVHHMLAHNGIKLLDLHFFGHVFLVLGCGVEVAGAS